MFVVLVLLPVYRNENVWFRSMRLKISKIRQTGHYVVFILCPAVGLPQETFLAVIQTVFVSGPETRLPKSTPPILSFGVGNGVRAGWKFANSA